MRNLKRALSLAMASVMLLGMMVVGTSAKGYDDVKETDNVEAIEVLQAIEVMVGDERGFGPDRPVNRAEMAVVMGLLLNLDYNYYSATCPFNDVYDWARGWVGACAANGIVSGRGEGVYDPGATVTAVEGASMLMRALGYFKYPSDYADGFEVSTVRQGTTIGIFDGVGSSATEPMTRNQVAQMVLNALKSGMVQPDGNTLNYFDNNGNIIATGGKINYVYVTSNKPFAQSISSVNATSMGSTNDNPIVELGEQLYNGELKLYDKRQDAFGRPSRIWEYKGQEIGTYVKKELLKQEYTKKVTGEDLYNLLTRNTIEDYRFRIYVDGVVTTTIDRNDNVSEANKAILGDSWFDTTDLYRTNKDGVGATGKGVLTQVFVDTEYVDPDDYTVYINIINTYLAKAKEDYNTKDDNVDLRVHAITDDGHANIYVKSNPDNADSNEKLSSIHEDMTVDGDEFSIQEVKEKDLFLVTVAEGRIQEMTKPEVISNTVINAFSRRDWINLSGTQYDYATTARYDVDVLYKYDNPNLKDVTYNVILDKYGYAIGLERNEDPDQYVFLTGIEQGYSNLTSRRVDANVIHLDGTMKTVLVDMRESELSEFDQPSQANTWCTYRVDSDGVYVLEEVAGAIKNPDGTENDAAQWATNVTGTDERVIDNKHITVPSGASTVTYGDDETVYLNVSTDNIRVDNGTDRVIIDDVDSVTVGHRNVNISVKNCKDGYNSDNGRTYTAPEDEIYALFDDDNYMIALVTIGVDEGTTSNWVYVTSASGKKGVSSEAYNGDKTATRADNDGKWTWTREVLSNGKKTNIKEVNKTIKYLDRMDQGKWYEVKYDADGNVRTEPKELNQTTLEGYVTTIKDVEAKVNQKDKVLLQHTAISYEIVFEKNGTLYLENDVTKGFPVSPDVKVALVLANKTAATFKTIEDCEVYSGYDGLRKAIDDLNVWYETTYGKGSWGKVELNAVIEGDSATSIIIRDDNAAPDNKPGTGTEKPAGNLTVTFDRTEYPTSGATFYLNGKALTTDDYDYVTGGKYSFAVKEKDVVEIFYNGQFTNVGKAGDYEAPDGTVYHAAANKSSVNFTVGKASIVVPKPADIVVKGDVPPAGTTSVIDKNIKIAGDYAKYVTGAHVLTADDVKTGATWDTATYASAAAGKLYLEWTLGANDTAADPMNVKFQYTTADGIKYSETGDVDPNEAQKTGTTVYQAFVAKTTKIDSGNTVDIEAFTTNGGTLTITPANPVASVAYKIKWTNQTGLDMVGGTTSGNIGTTGDTDIDLKLGGLGTNAKKIELTYKVSGLKDGAIIKGTADTATGTYKLESTSLTGGVATFTKMIEDANAKDSDVTITLVSYKVTEANPSVTVKGDAVGAVESDTTTSVEAGAGKTIKFYLKATAIPAGAKTATISYTATGIKGETTVQSGNVTLTNPAKPFVSLTNKEITGDVVITVTKVEVATYEVKSSAPSAPADEVTGVKVKASTSTAVNAGATDKTVVDNNDLKTLLASYVEISSKATGDVVVTFTIKNASLENGATTVTVEFATNAATADIATNIGTAVGTSDLVNITGPITITVSIAAK